MLNLIRSGAARLSRSAGQAYSKENFDNVPVIDLKKARINSGRSGSLIRKNDEQHKAIVP
jgi:hypothetical protein